MIKGMLRRFTPPVITEIRRPFIRKDLFEGNNHAFKEIVAGCEVYGEYGSGQSTLWAITNSTAMVYSVDSSRQWVDSIKGAAKGSKRLNIQWVNVGEVGDWGRPLSYEKREGFRDYMDWIWCQDRRPDCVLIDGRFRVACFLTSVLHAEAGTHIIFDDYKERQYYHIVEEIVQKDRESGRQAIFVVPILSDRRRQVAEGLLDKFRYVMD